MIDTKKIKIEKGIPLKQYKWSRWGDLIKNMAVMDSFEIKSDEVSNLRQGICQLVKRNEAHKTKKFSVKRWSKTSFRCWRIK
jgi:NRPS condensation-like uncharacterized protein